MLIVFIFFINMLSRLGLGPLLPEIERDFSFGHTSAGSLFLAVSFGYGLGLFGSTFVSARISHHQLIGWSSIAIGIVLGLVSLGRNLSMLRLALVGLGVAGGLYLPSGIAVLTSGVGKNDWGKVLSIHQLAPNMAYICAPLLAGYLLLWMPWRMILIGYGATAVLAGMYFLAGSHTGDYKGTAPSPALLAELIRDKVIWVMIFLFSLSLSVNQGVFAMMSLYLTTERGMDLHTANRLLAGTRIVAFGAPLLGGWFADRKGLKAALFLVIVSSSAATFSIALSPPQWIWAALFLQAVTSACFFPLGFAALSYTTRPETRSLAVSLTVPVGHFLGAGLGPALMGFSGDLVGFDAGFFVLGFLTLIGASFVWRLPLE